jgi:type II secretory pathway pseudopilin PulG
MTKVEPQRELLAYELQERAAPPPRRRRRPGRVAGAVVAAAVLILIGFGAGVLTRNSAVNDQQRRAASAEQQNSSLREQVASRQSKLDQQQRQIDQDREQRERLRAALARKPRPAQTPAGPNSASFNDGLYQLGVAIQPGQYHTDGSDSCYWAKLSTGDTNRVIVNHLGAGPQTVTIDSPYFESEGCGTWTKVG